MFGEFQVEGRKKMRGRMKDLDHVRSSQEYIPFIFLKNPVEEDFKARGTERENGGEEG